MVEEEAEADYYSDEEEEEDITGNVELRSNFNETAYFTSTLRTDAQGEATIDFTMPESLTSWNFKALAHTRDVSYGFLRFRHLFFSFFSLGWCFRFSIVS